MGLFRESFLDFFLLLSVRCSTDDNAGRFNDAILGGIVQKSLMAVNSGQYSRGGEGTSGNPRLTTCGMLCFLKKTAVHEMRKNTLSNFSVI